MLSGAEGRGANDLTLLIYFHKKNVVRRNQDIKMIITAWKEQFPKRLKTTIIPKHSNSDDFGLRRDLEGAFFVWQFCTKPLFWQFSMILTFYL